MGFERFGIVSFTSYSKMTAFIDRLDQGKVSGTRCTGCGAAYFPPRADCCACLSSNMEWFDLVGPGKLVSYSTLSYAPTGFEKDLPYTLGLVRFEGDLQAFGRLSKTIKPEELTVGMDLFVSPMELSDKRVAYEFRKP